ncbi:DUF3667 domain-containing protein [Sphingomonas endophytica]|uniref:DUF3667 domain-containing protein n=1 Tax=Sphingomonas endophytica TaxID=869719 RepID=A0A147I689_9SPHN|nr:DUF3667 domain-containing protein [Sphingomonas endophytica]KTT74259.1 hypothetical protein NS334_05570 [Sphingomonas endophytica]
MAGHINTMDGTAGATCLNCGATRVGDYCHVCGQSGHIHRTLGAWWHDFSHGVLHIEGAAWRTIAMLLRHPGALTRRYIDGERRRFLSPLALYLFSVFLLYIAYSVLGGFANVHTPDRTMQAQLSAEQSRVRGATALVERQRAAAAAAHRDTTGLDQRLRRLKDSQQELDTAARMLKQMPLPDDDREGGERIHTPWPALNAKLNHAIEDPELLLFKMEANGYKFSWALIPLSLPFMWLLFVWRRNTFLFDHAVFVTYSMSFVSLLTAMMILWSSALHLPGVALLMALFPVHLFAQVRGAYGLGNAAATVWTGALLVASLIVLILWVVLLLLLGIAH